jgi:hypothetical protein
MQKKGVPMNTPPANRLQLNSTTGYVPVELRALKAALLVENRAVLKTPSIASMARAFNITPYYVTKQLRAFGRKPRVYRRRSFFPPPSSSAPPAAPAFLAVIG